ncbi:Ig-like domain-containing protein, partial [Aquimarina sp. D1M17]|uniref:polysaccharide lyase n=1 Tax=Aquimarina acroporae TaxID=2937283 RepID=UPI0020BF56B5
MKARSLTINNWQVVLVVLLSIICGANAQNCSNSRLVIDQNFSQYNGQNKLYTRSMANNDFPRVAGRTSGGNVRGLSNDFPQRNRVINGELRAEFTKNDASGRSGGFVFDSSFDGAEEATLEYRVKFANDFVWATGGKLPGLGGASTPNGSQPAGCTQNQNTVNNAFSCRLMWRSNRAHTQEPYLIVYDYLPNRETRCGGNTRLGNLKLQRNKWYTVKQYLKLNTPGQKNGILKMYVDGQKLVDQDDVMFRLSGKGSVKINSIVMHTYRGGNRTDPVWHSPQDDYAYFDDFKVWTNCTGGGGNTGNDKPTVAITSPNNSSYDAGSDLSVTINANDPDGNIEKHEVFVNGNLVDTDGANYTPHPLTNIQAGNYTIKVVVTDNDGATAEDSTSFTVNSNDGGGDNTGGDSSCNGYEEQNGLVVIEAENLSISGNWKSKSNVSGFTGNGYLEWTGPDHFNDPGNGVISTKIRINAAGRYKFQWRSKVGEGDSPTEANDTWLKFPDASSFYAQKGSERVYPKGSGQTPNPEGAGGQGYFKVYSTGTTNWTWTTKTSDNDPHDIFVEFDSPGEYTMLISGRSKHHILDRITLNRTSANATDLSLAETKCDDNGSDNSTATITGERKKWHKVTLTFNGPNTSETASENPFLNYRLNVTFTHQSGAPSYVVPGYYAADGNAAQTSASNGNKWRAHFAPDKTGVWNYKVSFRKGNNVAVNDSNTAGTVAGFMEGETGSFTISASNKTGRDFRAKGRLQYVGEHYLKFAETGEYMIKQGPDSPENLLAYTDFDNTPNAGNRRKNYAPHVGDWNNGDPTWKNGKGKGLIGAVNYIASEGLNSMSFLTMNINGDDENVYPYIASNQRTRLDVSKLAQWAIVIEHMQKNGIFAHFKTQETENEILLDNGNTGTQRKLYYRELIARFGYNLALNWNLGEENGGGPQPVDQSPAQERAMAEYFYKNDPYHHHIVIHKHPNDFPDYLTGNQSRLTGFSLQTNKSDFSNVFSKVKEGIDDSRNAGKKWAVACDEPGDAQHAIRPDNNAANSHTDGRKNAMWATLLAGGWGNEWYFGYQNAHSDLSLQDFRSRDKWWDYGRHAIRFFEIANLPLTQMRNNNSLSSNNNDYCYAKQGEAYVVYLKNGGSTNLNLNGQSGQYTVKWYDPRNGGSLKNGSVTNISGGGNRSLGNAPNNGGQDWVILVTKNNTTPGENTPPAVSFVSPSGNISLQEGYTNFEVTVNASDSDGTIEKVELFIDDMLIRQEIQAPYEWGKGNNANELSGLSPGEHTIKAEATDNDGATTSKTFVVTVTGVNTNTPPVVTFTSPSGNLTVNQGYDLVVIAEASDSDGSIANVKLYINNVLVRQENKVPYEWGHDNSPN